jgi:hypothetical protein
LPKRGEGGVSKEMLVIVGRPKMHMIMKPYGILFKMKIITRRGTCKRNPIWVPKKDLRICKMKLLGGKMQPRKYINKLGRLFF